VLTAAEIAATVAQDNLTVAQDTVTRNNDRKAFYATWLHAPVSGTIASLSSLAPGDNVTAGTTSNVASSASSTSSTSSSTGAAGGLGGFAAASSTGSSSSNSGSSSSGSSSPFAEIVNTSALTMSVPLSESDISQVSDGQPATISLDALPSVELAAHVSAISPTATTSSGVVSYNVTLTMDQTNSQVKPGMSASASIIVKQASGVTVPVDALTGASSLATVNLKKGSATVPTQVVVGLRGTNDAQIVSGLSPGEQIVVKTTLPALNTSVSSGSSSTSSGTLGGGTGGTGGFAGRGGGGGGGGGGGFAARLGG
jgi:multidrug efflux pump subunit AcrA (membrane-fusion protein)